MGLRNPQCIILGAGMTGLAAGMLSGMPVYEASDNSGGICSSYYMQPGRHRCLYPNSDRDAYRFEVGGGHWIWCNEPLVQRLIRSITPMKSYVRRAAVYFCDKGLLVPYPIQNHLRYLEPQVAAQALGEIVEASRSEQPVVTMAEWLRANFGKTLCELFFDPFHELYTAGLHKSIAPQEARKSPLDLPLSIRGAFEDVPPVGYNVSFLYPTGGLDMLARRMAAKCNIHYNKRAMRVEPKDKTVYFEDGSAIHYEALFSTLPLSTMMEIAGLSVDGEQNPYSSVLVINVGAMRAPCCPDEHWVYIPRSAAGFHRVGFYSNVDTSFLPELARNARDHLSLYVEKAYQGRQKPNDDEIGILCGDVIRELQEWRWIGSIEVVDCTWIDVAYTWSLPGSTWTEQALKELANHGICQVGRFARWSVSQGIADSIRDGILAVAAYKVDSP